MKTINYICCFCGKPGLVQYEENSITETPAFLKIVASLPKRIACDPCARFHRRKSDLSRAVVLMGINWSREPIYERDDVRSKVGNKLAGLIRKLCNEYEKFYHLPSLFDSQMVEMILDNPEKASKIVVKIDWMAKHPPLRHQTA